MKGRFYAVLFSVALLAHQNICRAEKSNTASKLVVTSVYHDKFEGRETAAGDRFRQSDLTAAHRSLPLGTRLRIENPENGRAVIVKVNDRGPFIRGRELDITRAAAKKLGITRKKGIAKVVMRKMKKPGTAPDNMLALASVSR